MPQETYFTPSAVALSDTVDAPRCLAWTANVGGTLTYLSQGGVSFTLTVVAGVVYPLSIKRFMATGTTGVAGITVWS